MLLYTVVKLFNHTIVSEMFLNSMSAFEQFYRMPFIGQRANSIKLKKCNEIYFTNAILSHLIIVYI